MCYIKKSLICQIWQIPIQPGLVPICKYQSDTLVRSSYPKLRKSLKILEHLKILPIFKVATPQNGLISTKLMKNYGNFKYLITAIFLYEICIYPEMIWFENTKSTTIFIQLKMKIIFKLKFILFHSIFKFIYSNSRK